MHSAFLRLYTVYRYNRYKWRLLDGSLESVEWNPAYIAETKRLVGRQARTYGISVSCAVSSSLQVGMQINDDRYYDAFDPGVQNDFALGLESMQ